MAKFIQCIIAMALSYPLMGWAQTTPEVVESCQYVAASKEAVEGIANFKNKSQGLCIGMVEGIIANNLAVEALLKQRNQPALNLLCVPDGFSLKNMAKIISDTVKQNPSLKSQSAPGVVFSIMIDEMPCKRFKKIVEGSPAYKLAPKEGSTRPD